MPTSGPLGPSPLHIWSSAHACVAPNRPPNAPPSLLRFAPLQSFQCEERLSDLSPKCCFIAAEAIEDSIFQIRYAQKATRDWLVDVRSAKPSESIGHIVDPSKLGFVRICASELEKAGLDRGCATQPPEQACQPQHELAFNG
jgi:hypothetical protein